MNAVRTEWTQEEFIRPANIQKSEPEILRMRIPPFMFYRKLYCYLEAIRTDTTAPRDFYVKAEVVIKREGQVMVRLPANIALDTTNSLLDTKKSLVSVFVNGLALPDSIVVALADQFNETTVILNPRRLVTEGDEVAFSILDYDAYNIAVVGYRVFIGVESSSHPF